MTIAPIFQSVFGKQWNALPPVMRTHYANRPYSHDVVTVEGRMQITLSRFMRLLSPLLLMTGALVPYAGENIPVTVHFRSMPDSNAYGFERIFHFPGRAAFRFHSRMLPAGNDEVVEFMRIGIGWRARYWYDGRKVVMEHRGYVVKLFGKLWRLPLELFLGRGYCEEEALSDDSFRMYMDIRHPLLGIVYVYKGEFTIKEVAVGG